MQKIIIEKPYRFVPPQRGNFWASFIKHTRLHAVWLKRDGVVSHEVRHAERLRESIDQGRGVLLAPNHCRTSDPLVMGFLAQAARCNFYGMASWHLFNQDFFTCWAIRAMGGFSINREGVDREAINAGIEVLVEGQRPLIIFPEGAVSRTNDRLHALLDGVAFIARTAAKRRERDGNSKGVVMHPVAIKYLFQGDVQQRVDEVLTDIEHRLSWLPQSHLKMAERVAKTGRALLSLKEIEYFNEVQSGTLAARLAGLINRLLHPLEKEWLGKPDEGPVVPRVKALRMKILPDMVKGNVDEAERQRRWRQLADLYLTQQVSCYPADYLVSLPTKDRYLETIERFEEDLTDKARRHIGLKVVIDVGEPLPVDANRQRGLAQDPLMVELAARMQAMLDPLRESPLVE